MKKGLVNSTKLSSHTGVNTYWLVNWVIGKLTRLFIGVVKIALD